MLLYVLFTFVQLDIAFTSWGQIQDELGFSIGHLNGSTALGYAGLGIGSIFFIPLMHKYGRRPMYILSSTMQLGGVIWLARLQTVTDLWLGNLLAGLGGAVCETIVQVTISDVFFVHQHASMNALYMLATCMGAYLGPVAAGYVVEAQGWRWIWWWCVILLGTQLLFTIFCFEESKYTTILINGRPEGYEHQPQDQDQDQDKPDDSRREEVEDDDADTDIKKNFFQRMDRTLSHRFIDYNLPKNSYKKRMALITPTSGPIWNNPLVPFRVFSFYAIAYTALVFGSILALFSILTSVQAAYMYGPPWNFSSQGVGLMNVAPFIGSIFGAYVGGHLSDQSIVWLAKRNGGIYEPEMRLWFALPSIILAPASVLMLGLGLAYVSEITPSYSFLEDYILITVGRILAVVGRWLRRLWLRHGRYLFHCPGLCHGLLRRGKLTHSQKKKQALNVY